MMTHTLFFFASTAILLSSCGKSSPMKLGDRVSKTSELGEMVLHYDVFGPSADTGLVIVTSFKNDRHLNYYFISGVMSDTVNFYMNGREQNKLIFNGDLLTLNSYDEAFNLKNSTEFSPAQSEMIFSRKHYSWKQEKKEGESVEGADFEDGVDDMMMEEECEVTIDISVVAESNDISDKIVQFNSRNKFKNVEDLFKSMHNENEARDIRFFPFYMNEKVLTYALKFESYPCGAAHGMFGTSFYNYDLEKGEIVPVNELFPLDNKAFVKLLQSEYWRNFPDSDKNWQFKVPSQIARVDGGILIHYNPYEVASFAQGEMEFFLSYDQLKPFGIKDPNE